MIIDTEKLKPGVYALNVFEEGRPLVEIDWKQGWFWMEDWVSKELEVSKDIEKGNVESFDTIEEFLETLPV